MNHLNHVVLTDTVLKGPEYGMLRDFEDEIVRLTGAHRVPAPRRNLPSYVEQRIAHGTRYSGLRSWIPKAKHDLKADVLWAVLMGPESFMLDLFRDWDGQVGFKILYLFDTMEKQLPSIRRVLQCTKWDIAITSFQGALPFLEEGTQRKWYCVPQGVKLERFQPEVANRKIIDFCAYGRRQDKVHSSIKRYCFGSGKFYDYTTAASLQSQLDPLDNYQIYSRHLNHAAFNFCWPVELTHPDRVLSFSPITCRWFEAAASGNVILGQAPQDPGLEEVFGPDLVMPVDYNGSEGDMQILWQNLWHDKEHLLQKALERRATFSHKWSWESRVQSILTFVHTACNICCI